MEGRTTLVAVMITFARPRIERDVGARLGRLIVDLHPNHASFAAALRSQQHTSAQSVEDNTSAIVYRRLLLGSAPARYLPHDLVHVYTEWALGHLTRNTRDALPANPWLYDGIAAYEA